MPAHLHLNLVMQSVVWVLEVSMCVLSLLILSLQVMCFECDL